MVTPDSFDVKFTSREVSAWGGLALLKRMLDGMDFKSAMQSWRLPSRAPTEARRPEQLLEQMIVSILVWGRSLLSRRHHSTGHHLDTLVWLGPCENEGVA